MVEPAPVAVAMVAAPAVEVVAAVVAAAAAAAAATVAGATAVVGVVVAVVAAVAELCQCLDKCLVLVVAVAAVVELVLSERGPAAKAQALQVQAPPHVAGFRLQLPHPHHLHNNLQCSGRCLQSDSAKHQTHIIISNHYSY